MQLNELIQFFNAQIPPQFQESYDNSGLLVDRENQEINMVLLTLDVNDEVIDEAIELDADIIIAHHPLIFKPLKSISGKNPVGAMIRKLIKNDIALFCAHTNFDSLKGGINDYLCRLLGLKNVQVLSPMPNFLNKVVVFVPHEQANKVREAMFNAGAGTIGDYDHVSFNIDGTGSFRAGEDANPFVGEIGEVHKEPEVRIETIVPNHLLGSVIAEMIKEHPYEEVAYDVYPLKNDFYGAGIGRVGVLEQPIEPSELISLVTKRFDADHIRYTNFDKKIQKVAICSGSGSGFISKAKQAKADVYISGDFKYHDFQQGDSNLMLVDVGHYHSEKFVKDVFYEIIKENFPKFAAYLSKVNTNPINLY